MMTFQFHSDFIILKHARLRFQFWNLYFHIFHFQYSLFSKILFSILTNTISKIQTLSERKKSFYSISSYRMFLYFESLWNACVCCLLLALKQPLLCFPRANLVFLLPTKYLHLPPSNILNTNKLQNHKSQQEQWWWSLSV